jgi:predicted phage baseplate assembly protein
LNWPGGGISRIWNPLAASGGTDPEPSEEVRLYAPQAFRTQERAVTPGDYAEISQRRSDVQRAVATQRWTGSWYTIFVTADRKDGQPVNQQFRQELGDYLERYRMAGHDLELNDPVFVPLYLSLIICVKPGYRRSDVKESLLKTFSNRNLPGGARGFFHPDNFTFGQPLYLSQVYQVAMQVAGVASVEITIFQRWGKTANRELEKGVLNAGRLEVLRLDNDPNFAENGKLDFLMKGGL